MHPQTPRIDTSALRTEKYKCGIVCVQGRLIILPKCGCAVSEYYNTSFLAACLYTWGIGVLGGCESLSEYQKSSDATFLDVMVWNVCALMRTDSTPDSCNKECVSTCHQSLYHPTVIKSGPWPHIAGLDQIYVKYINGTSIEDDFRGVRTVLSLHSSAAAVFH